MSKIKLAAVRVNGKEQIVQIKVNRGPNYTLKGDMATKFKARRDAYIQDKYSISESDVLAANDYLEGRLQ